MEAATVRERGRSPTFGRQNHMSEHKMNWLAPGARRHVAKMLSALAPQAQAVDPATLLGDLGFAPDAITQLVLISPAAASRARSLDAFFTIVECSARELARLRVTPDDATTALRDID